jgi:zinc/manganese transport system substrate-binding protein
MSLRSTSGSHGEGRVDVRVVLATLLVVVGLAVPACSTAPSGPAAPGLPLRVVAAENVWGSIATQLGGDLVHVTSIIDNPDADPHDYEPTSADARAVATADLVLVNGVGYDTWASKLAAANENPARVDLDVGDVVGAREGDNPHRWYDPADVAKVVDALVAGYTRLDPAGAPTFARLRTTFETTGTAAYRAAATQIRTRYGGVPVGASESIMAMLSPSLGLHLVTPAAFLRAVSEGNDPSAADKATIDEQIRSRSIAVYVVNSQNTTPDVQAQVSEATAAGIPVTTITETMVPATATWQQWQTAQLLALGSALAAGTSR